MNGKSVHYAVQMHEKEEHRLFSTDSFNESITIGIYTIKSRVLCGIQYTHSCV